MPMPLVAIQLLWLNVITDGIQDIALSFEKGEDHILKEKPRNPKENLFDKTLIQEILVSGLYIGILVFGVWVYLLKYLNMDIKIARGYVMTFMIIIQNVHAFNCRSEKKSILDIKLTDNLVFLVGIIGSIILGIAIIEIDFFNVFLKTTYIPSTHLLILLFLSLTIIVVMECLNEKSRV